MVHLIDKDTLVAEIERRINVINLDSIEDWRYRLQREHDIEVMKDILSLIDTLEVKEMDLELITGWFDHIAQIADDRTTLTNQRMTDAHALDEIKCLAKNSSEFITKYYKTQKGDNM